MTFSPMLHGRMPLFFESTSENSVDEPPRCARRCADDNEPIQGANKVVRFHPHLETEIKSEEDGPVPSNVLWYQKEEIKAFREQFVAHAKQVARCNRGGRRRSNSSGSTSSSSSASSLSSPSPTRSGCCCASGRGSTSCTRNDTILQAFQACCQAHDESSRRQAALVCAELSLTTSSSRISSTASCIGLEHMVSRQIAKDKLKRRNRLVQKVLEYQEQDGKSLNGKSYGNDNAQEELRRACEQISRPSRLFAQLLAAAVATKVAKAA